MKNSDKVSNASSDFGSVDIVKKGDDLSSKDNENDDKITAKIWGNLLMGTLLMFVAGSNYGFPAWSDSLKTRRGYSQPEIALVGSLGNTGQYGAIVTGVVIDVYGKNVGLVIGAFLTTFGWGLMYLTDIGVTPSLGSSGIQGLLYLLNSLGASALFLCGVSSNVNWMPSKYRGAIVGYMFGTYALCAVILSGIYTGPFNATDLGGFFLMMTIAQAAVGIAAVFFLLPLPKKNLGRVKQEDMALLENGNTQPDNRPRLKSFFSKLPAGVQTVIEVFIEKVTDLSFWLLFVSLFLGVGPGLLHINNIGQLTKALNGGQTAATVTFATVTIQSVCNALGRFATGLTDKFRIRRGWFYTAGIFSMGISHLLAALLFTEGNFASVYGVTILTGIAFGAIFSLNPTIMTETWAPNDFAQNWGWMLLSAAGASFAYNAVAAKFYDAQITPEMTTEFDVMPNECVGSQCFRNAYFFGFGMSMLGVIVSLFLIPRTKYGLKLPEDSDFNPKLEEQRRKVSSIAGY